MSERPTPDVVPAPGSEDAANRGCKCPRMDNGWGRGAYGGGAKDPETGETIYWITGGCPLHDPDNQIAKPGVWR